MKQITRNELNALLDNGIIHNSHRGMVDCDGNVIGYSVSKRSIFIEDKYADIATDLYRN